MVAEERPDLEEAKNQLIVSNAKMKQELKEIEDKILHRLSSSEGSPVDDIDLINVLQVRVTWTRVTWTRVTGSRVTCRNIITTTADDC